MLPVAFSPLRLTIALLWLLKKRIDVYISVEFVAWHISKQIPGAHDQLRTINALTNDLSYYLLFAKTNKRSALLIDEFNAGLKQLRASRSYTDIINLYHNKLRLKQWAPKI